MAAMKAVQKVCSWAGQKAPCLASMLAEQKVPLLAAMTDLVLDGLSVDHWACSRAATLADQKVCSWAGQKAPCLASMMAEQKVPLMAAMTVSRMAYSKAGLKVP